jgi:hypothetical protein
VCHHPLHLSKNFFFFFFFQVCSLFFFFFFLFLFLFLFLQSTMNSVMNEAIKLYSEQEILMQFLEIIELRDRAALARTEAAKSVVDQKSAVAEGIERVNAQVERVNAQVERVNAQKKRVAEHERNSENAEFEEAQACLEEAQAWLERNEGYLMDEKRDVKREERYLKDERIKLEKRKLKLEKCDLEIENFVHKHGADVELLKKWTNDVARITDRIASIACDIEIAAQRVSCFRFLFADTTDDKWGFMHRCGVLHVDARNRFPYRCGDLLHMASFKRLFPVPRLDRLSIGVAERVAAVKDVLDAMPASKVIREQLAAVVSKKPISFDFDADFLRNVVAIMRQEDASATPLLRDMRAYVAGAAEFLLHPCERRVEARDTKWTLLMECSPLVINLSVRRANFGDGASRDGSRLPDVFMKSAFEEWRVRDASIAERDAQECLLVTFALKAIAESKDTSASIVVFTTMQVGYERTTHATVVHGNGGLVRFQLCHIDNIRGHRSFVTLVSSICQIYEYERTINEAALQKLFAAAAPACAANAPQQPWEGLPCHAILRESKWGGQFTRSHLRTLQSIDPAVECALMTGLRWGTTTRNNGDSILIAAGQRVFKMICVTHVNLTDVRREVQLLTLAHRLAPLHVVSTEHAFSTTQFRWPCPFLECEAVDIVALVMPRLAPLDWSELDMAEFARFGGQLCEALAALHAVLIVHFDVNPENIAVDAASWQLKLLNFSAAQLFVGERTVPIYARGTESFMAPEMKDAWRSKRMCTFSPAADVFSAGITLRESPHATSCAAACNIIEQMTVADETKRISAQDAAKRWRKTVAGEDS